ncbi:crotonase/enoyl-CoA hydratase family protein [Novosphingobium sp.]|uniref:crotonase/enoyl-CoA hydratase family protein n=1 Tax=Novosphingobium sp. TaxID=1874826 RepID=UPI0027348159|nr:crotonase/enoyl-CoA hydratase family protein [Novosphingobium sp.]MDP3906083.1 crotonase/enoyl-CoA hydratase family protein [Novosphingobium sp.]
MDRISGDLGGGVRSSDGTDGPAIGLPDEHDELVTQSAQRLAVPPELLALNELDVLYDEPRETLWTFMAPTGRPSFTPSMLGDFDNWQRLIADNFKPGQVPLKYLVLGSRAPGVFCFGGDLALFEALIRSGNRDALAMYGYRCVEILHRNINALDLPILTIGLVQGQALGGGFEALMSFDHIIAERGSTFGLPEVMFGLFPGMGAHAILSRKLGGAMADRLILSNETFTAEQMFELGIVHQLAEPGAGVAAVQDYIARSVRRHSGLVGARRASRRANEITLGELCDIVDHWADAALQLREQDLKLMHRLAAAQSRLPRAASVA